MRRRKNGLPAMLALTILLSGISEQPTWSYAAEQIEAPEALDETQPDTENMGETEELPASGEAGTNETGEKDTEPETGTGSGSGSETGDVSGPESEPETEDKSETRESESETASEVETESETEGSTENESEPETEASTEPESEPDTEASTEPESEPESESESDSEPESEAETESDETKDTEEDFSGSNFYYWDDSWYIRPDFRFIQVKKQYVLVRNTANALVYEQTTTGSKVVGYIPYMGTAYLLKHIETAEGGWAYIESGEVRGFVQQQNLIEGIFAEKTAETIGEKNLKTGIAFCERAENAAYTYTHTTAQPVLASKRYAIMLQGGPVYEYESETSKVIGTTTSGTTVYALVDNENGWVYIESGDVRGFVEKNRLLSGSAARTLALDQNITQTATACVEPEDNRSLYYTLRSTQEAVSANQTGIAVAAYAAGFAGRLQYVWGGTSLSVGADCSGFTQAVYQRFGISIPRLAEEQGISGEPVANLAMARPGDIVCYGSHVGIYLGNGKVAQCSGDRNNTAANPGRGVTICAVDYRPIASIRRYLINTESGYAEGNYRIDPTNYTISELELIYAIVAQEDNGSYEGALAVISSAMNRTESAQWGRLGGNALSQLTAPGQYCYSMDHYWKKRLNGNVPDYVVRAVSDCLKRGIRNHKYTSFRSRKGSQTGASAIQIGGNWFFGS
ncbi:MAG: NlpC/P60 family protein [Lachnospiraceae bacterium]